MSKPATTHRRDASAPPPRLYLDVGKTPAPELVLALFAFLLHFAWELVQVPLYADMATAAHADATLVCLKATLGDVAMALVAYWGAAVWMRDRRWLFGPTPAALAIYLLIGLLLTVVFELLATGPLERWRYGAAMPVVPGLGVGLSPLMQWVLIPPFALWLARRHMAGAAALKASQLR